MGTHRDTGELLEGLEDVQQSVGEIMRTPLRTRPMRPDFGADLLGSVDVPLNRTGQTKIISKTAGAVQRWEPRLNVTRVRLDGNADGETTIDLEGTVDGRSAAASSYALGVPDVRRFLRPTGYYDASSYDQVAGAWRSRAGGDDLVPFAAFAAPFVTTEGVYFSTNTALWLGSYGALPIAPTQRWTIGVAYTVRSAATDFALFALLGYDGVTSEDWLTYFPQGAFAQPRFFEYTSGVNRLAQNVVVHGTAWLWFHPADGATPARFGYINGSGVSVEVTADMPDPLLPLVLRIGGEGTAGGVVDRGVTHVGIWPRVLSARERLGIASLWDRERAG